VTLSALVAIRRPARPGDARGARLRC